MGTRTEDVLSKALGLSSEARAFVAEKLIESLDAPANLDISPEWREEITKRCREIERGAVELRDATDVFAKAYGMLK